MPQNPFENAMRQLDRANEIIHLDSGINTALRKPDRVLSAILSVKMDSGENKQFQAFRVQYNDARGPYKGGIRYHIGVTEDEVKALSFWMAMKCAVAGLPLGGGKGGIIVDPKTLSKSELERLSREYMRAFYEHFGPAKDVPAPDVATNSEIMSWMLDEYETLIGKHAPGMITGKPLALGGSRGRDFATAQGGVYVLLEAIKKLGMQASKTRVVIQGFGNAGSNMAFKLAELGFTIVGISDSNGGVASQNGLDIAAIKKQKQETGKVSGIQGTQAVSNDELLELDTDILIPAALENVITEKNAEKIRAKLIVELANGPLSPEADDILHKRGILFMPDILANAGGVTVSYFEQVQNAMNYYWTEAEVLEKLQRVMVDSFQAVWEKKERHNVNMRTAAFILSVERVAEAMRYRA